MSNRLETIQLELQENSYNWLVTGAAGFIGSHLVQFLLDNNQNVLAVDNFSTGHDKNLQEVKRIVSEEKWSRFKFFEGDIRNYKDCQHVVKDVDYVLHQAALGSVPLV